MSARCVTGAVVVALTVCTLHAQGPAGVSPQTLLSGVPAEVEKAVWPLAGVIASARGVDRWRLLVNDAQIFESAAGSGLSATPIRLGIILRQGDNLVTLEGIAGARAVAIPIERWSTHVHRADPEATQFALLAAGDSSAQTTGHVKTIRAALEAGGVRAENIVTVSDPAAFAAQLSELGPRTRSRDQVLIYYAGPGRVAPGNNEPQLLFERPDAPVPVGDVIREASDLPRASMLLDIAYTTPSGGPTKALNRTATSAPWLRALSDTALEVAYTNPSTAAVGSSAGFTQDFVSEWQAGGAGTCKTFARIAQAVAAANSQKSAAWPLFFAQGDSSFRFCSTPEAARRPLTIRPAPDLDRMRPFTFVDVALPDRSAGAGLTVNGVPVPVPSSPDSKSGLVRVPIGAGLHIVEARPANAGDAPPLTGKTGCAGLPSNPCGTERQSSGRWSSALVARIEPTHLPALTSEGFVAMSFVVGGESSDIRYQIRNNGVVVMQEVVKLSARVLRRQIVQRIPLLVGTNNLALDVIDGAEFASSRVVVERRRSQTVRAVIVGVDAASGAPQLASAANDARHMHALLLEYSDASPRDLRLLTGADATREAVLQAIARSGETGTAVPQPPSDDSTFVLYFAGYGLSVGNPGRGPTRCLVTADFDPGRPMQTCLSTEDVSSALDKVGRAIVIVDTSYDGPAGPRSRTYSSFQTSDPTWRLTSGTDRPDRLFLVAAGSNSAAYETSEGGLFTQALEEVVRTRLNADRGSDVQELPLLDAWDRARAATSSKSDRKQVPVMKGVLSEPFHFVRKTTATVKQEANSIERAARNDLTAMRTLDPRRLSRAEALYEKALAVNGSDLGAHLGMARIRTLQGQLTAAAEVLGSARALLAVPSPEHAEWLTIAADIKMRNGDIPGALSDAQAAIASDAKSQTAAAQLGLLYGIAGEYVKSLATLEPLLVAGAGENGALTEEERGRVLLHAYVALRHTGRNDEADLLLRSYFAALRGQAWPLRSLYQNRLVRTLLARRHRIIELGQVGVQTPWSHLVGQFFRDREKYEPLLKSFLEDTEPFDPRDPSAFNCLVHFYVGMFNRLNQNASEAAKEFEAAVATGKTAYPEYWMAHAQLNRTQH